SCAASGRDLAMVPAERAVPDANVSTNHRPPDRPKGREAPRALRKGIAEGQSALMNRDPARVFVDVNQSERAKGFEPSTSALGRLHSTTELRPHHRPRNDKHLRASDQNIFQSFFQPKGLFLEVPLSYRGPE